MHIRRGLQLALICALTGLVLLTTSSPASAIWNPFAKPKTTTTRTAALVCSASPSSITTAGQVTLSITLGATANSTYDWTVSGPIAKAGGTSNTYEGKPSSFTPPSPQTAGGYDVTATEKPSNNKSSLCGFTVTSSGGGGGGGGGNGGGTTLPEVDFTKSQETSTTESGTITVKADVVNGITPTSPITMPFSISVTSSATNGTDYTISPSDSITIPTGQTQSADITITITNDTIDDDNESIEIVMGDPTNATKTSTSIFTAYITDDDSAPPPPNNDGPNIEHFYIGTDDHADYTHPTTYDAASTDITIPDVPTNSNLELYWVVDNCNQVTLQVADPGQDTFIDTTNYTGNNGRGLNDCRPDNSYLVPILQDKDYRIVARLPNGLTDTSGKVKVRVKTDITAEIWHSDVEDDGSNNWTKSNITYVSEMPKDGFKIKYNTKNVPAGYTCILAVESSLDPGNWTGTDKECNKEVVQNFNMGLSENETRKIWIKIRDASGAEVVKSNELSITLKPDCVIKLVLNGLKHSDQIKYRIYDDNTKIMATAYMEKITNDNNNSYYLLLRELVKDHKYYLYLLDNQNHLLNYRVQYIGLLIPNCVSESEIDKLAPVEIKI